MVCARGVHAALAMRRDRGNAVGPRPSALSRRRSYADAARTHARSRVRRADARGHRWPSPHCCIALALALARAHRIPRDTISARHCNAMQSVSTRAGPGLPLPAVDVHAGHRLLDGRPRRQRAPAAAGTDPRDPHDAACVCATACSCSDPFLSHDPGFCTLSAVTKGAVTHLRARAYAGVRAVARARACVRACACVRVRACVRVCVCMCACVCVYGQELAQFGLVWLRKPTSKTFCATELALHLTTGSSLAKRGS